MWLRNNNGNERRNKMKKTKEKGRAKLSLGVQKRMLLSRLPAKERAIYGRTATAISAAIAGVSGAVAPVSSVLLLDFDFQPVQSWESGYNINWPGPPRHNLTWPDVRFYKPVVAIKDPAPLNAFA
jgi:hypothetical protein